MLINAVLSGQVDVNAKDKYGRTALEYAAKGWHTETVNLLLNRGADANAKNEGGTTALMFAVSTCRDTVKLLLDHGADVNAICDKQSVLYQADPNRRRRGQLGLPDRGPRGSPALHRARPRGAGCRFGHARSRIK